jgi:L-ascorbate metabolism protein UlaG (beta-lactamase superfamily)
VKGHAEATVGGVELTKYSHSCVVLDGGDGRVVIDPGVWSEHESLDEAAAVLITHEHADHIDADRLAATGLPVHAPSSVAALLPVQEVRPGDTFEVCGLSVQVLGGEHAEVYGGQPGCPNVGYLVDGALYHPGDAFHVPDVDVDTLLLPVAAPWLKTAEAIDFARAVRPRRAVPIHDAVLSGRGKLVVDRWLGEHGGAEYLRLEPGATLPL